MQNKEEHLVSPEKGTHKYVLQLFVTGATPNSVRAITNIKQVSEDVNLTQGLLEVMRCDRSKLLQIMVAAFQGMVDLLELLVVLT